MNGRCRVLFSALFGCGRGHASKPSIAAVTDKPRATAKVGCPWQLTLTCHAHSPDSVSIETPVGHQRHQPGSAEDNALLKPSKEVEAYIWDLLKLGAKPTAIVARIDTERDRELLAEQQGEEWLASFSNPRRRVRLEDVRRVQKAILQSNLIDSNDVTAVECLVEVLGGGAERTVLLYQRQIVQSGVVTQPLVIIISSPFQRQMLRDFGGDLVCLDATGAAWRLLLGFVGAAKMHADMHACGPRACLPDRSNADARGGQQVRLHAQLHARH